jgi:NAD(P)H dehydrogenase (quinone)
VSESKILVTGATGETGGHTVDILRESGLDVRAFVHSRDARAEALEERGAEVVVGDLQDLDAVRAALEGITGAYFVYPIAPGLLSATAFFAQAAQEAGAPSVVNMSQISARREAASNAAREHWVAERVFDWSGLPVTHLRPTFFAEWFVYPFSLAGITGDGRLRLPFGSGRHAPIAARDQARVIAAILERPAKHAGQTYSLYGSVEGTHFDHAEAIGRVLGKEIVYEPIPIEEFADNLRALAPQATHLIQHLSCVALDYQNGVFEGTNDVIEQITGTPPMSLEEFVSHNQDAFGPAAPVP